MRLAPRIAIVVSILTLVVSIVGFIGAMILNAFVLDDYDAYGEVPIPGSSSLHLPAGEATVSFHTLLTGRPTGGFPMPPLGLSIDAPVGAPKPEVTESRGGTTTVNSDMHARVWVVQIAKAGTYDVTTDGQVDGYINPSLAFGKDSSSTRLWWLFGGLLVAGLCGLIAALSWSARVRKKARPLEPHELSTFNQPTWSTPQPAANAAGYAPGDQGIRLEQLRQLAALRDSGALTEDEYTAEKRRILDS